MLANTMPLRTEVLLGNAICVIAICTTVFVWLELLFVSLHIESLSAREFGFMKRQWEDGTDDDWGDWSKFGKKQEPAPFLRQAELDRRRQQQQEATAATRVGQQHGGTTTWWGKHSMCNNMVEQAQDACKLIVAVRGHRQSHPQDTCRRLAKQAWRKRQTMRWRRLRRRQKNDAAAGSNRSRRHPTSRRLRLHLHQI